MVQAGGAIRNSLNTIRNSFKRRDIESQLLHHDQQCRRHSIWWKIGIDIPLFAIVALLVGAQEFGMIPQRKSGFFCNDPALSYPYKGDTVSMAVLLPTVVAFPLIVVFITELIFQDLGHPIQHRLCRSAIETLMLLRSYAYGLVINLILLVLMKAVTGFPRPTFFDICEPDTALTCNGSEFVSTFECTSQRYSSLLQTDSYRSFPSGHTSLSVYCGFFVAWYLQVRAFSWSNRTVFLVPAVQLACLGFSTVTSLSRISDRRHHWWDVVTGAVLGALCLLYTAIVLCENFSKRKTCKQSSATEANIQSNRTSLSEVVAQLPT